MAETAHDNICPTWVLTVEAEEITHAVPSSAASTTPSPSCDRCAMSALAAATFALPAGVPPATHALGPLTNASITPVAASLAGSAADDVTATVENTHACTE